MQRHSQTIREGLAVGGIAYVTALVLYGAFDFLAARDVLFTADFIGRALIMGLRDPAVHLFPHRLDPTAVLWSGGLQLPVSLAAGMGVAAVVDWSDRRSMARRWVATALMAAAAVALIGADLLAAELRLVLPWSSILIANGVALATATTFLFTRMREAPHT